MNHTFTFREQANRFLREASFLCPVGHICHFHHNDLRAEAISHSNSLRESSACSAIYIIRNACQQASVAAHSAIWKALWLKQAKSSRSAVFLCLLPLTGKYLSCSETNVWRLLQSNVGVRRRSEVRYPEPHLLCAMFAEAESGESPPCT